MEKIRTFIAYKVSEQAREELIGVQGKLKKYNKKAHVGWSSSRGFHVTVEFLGEIEPHVVEQVKEILHEIANSFHGFSFWLDRLDGFPNKARPRVITMRVEEEKRTSHALHEELIQKLREIGLGKDDHPWKAHITIGRNRGEARIDGLETIEFEKVVWKVDSVELIKSDLQSGGPRYTVLESYSLQSK